MKNSKRIISLLLVIAAILSVTTITAFAAENNNHEDIDIWPIPLSINWFTYARGTAGQKKDTSPVYLHVEDGNRAAVKVSARGCDSDGNNGVNWTYSNGKVVDFVTCTIGEQYLIQSLISEKGYSYAVLWFKSTNVLGDSISGVWSPDSVGSYQYAS